MGEESKNEDDSSQENSRPASVNTDVGVEEIQDQKQAQKNSNFVEGIGGSATQDYTPTQPYESSPKPLGRYWTVAQARKTLLKVRESRSDWVKLHGDDDSDSDNSNSFSGNRNPAQAWTHTRLPWMDDYNPKMIGYVPDDIATPLFDCSMLRGTSAEVVRDEDSYWIDIFFKKRYYKAKKRSTYDPTVRSSPHALAHSWHSFVNALLNDPQAWFDKLDQLATGFFNYDIDAPKMEIHQRSIAENQWCCLRRSQECPMCYEDSHKAPTATRSGKNGVITPELFGMIQSFDTRWANYVMLRKERAKIARANDAEDEGFLAQISQAWIEQQFRDTGSRVFGLQTANLLLQTQVSNLEKRDKETQNMVKELKEDLAEMERVIGKRSRLMPAP